MTSESMSCRETLERLWEMIDQELDAGSEARVREHLEACQRCYPQYDFQRAFREFVGRKCRHEVPAEVRRKIFFRLLEEG